VGVVLYLATLPLGYLSYQRHARETASAAAGAAATADLPGAGTSALPPHAAPDKPIIDPPTRH
jgi:hypothetical protein